MEQDGGGKSKEYLYGPFVDLLKSFKKTTKFEKGAIQALAGEQSITETLGVLLNLFPLQQVNNQIVSFLAAGLDSENNATRTKSVKYISEILSDSQMNSLLQSMVRRKLIVLLGDKSSIVRDSAVDVLGKHLMTLAGEELVEHYQILSSRIFVSKSN